MKRLAAALLITFATVSALPQRSGSALGRGQYRNAVASGQPRASTTEGSLQSPDATALRYRPRPTLAQCKVGVAAAPIGFWSWAPESKISVYIVESDFQLKEVEFLLAPLSTWNTVSEATGSNVKFEYKGLVNHPLYCENCLTIVRGEVFDKSRRHLTELRTYSAARNRIMTWATIVIDPLLTNPKTLTNALVHELGHSFGLLDCYSCKKQSTVMIQFKTVNVPNDMDRPSACDVVQVKLAYQTLAAQLKRVTQTKPVEIDEGEEPVEDDTPVVIRKP